MMKRTVLLLVAAFAVLPSCNKHPNTPDGDSPSFAKQWLLKFESYEQVYDYSVEPGFCFRAPGFWKDLPDATYLVDDMAIYPYTYVARDGGYRLTVKVYGDGTPEARLYEDFDNITETTASYKSTYHDSTVDEVETARATVMAKPVKMIRSPFCYVGLKLGFGTSNLQTTPGGQERFGQMARAQSGWKVVVLGKEGAAADYAGVDVSGKIVAVTHTFTQPAKRSAGLTPAQKREIAAGQGAAGLILQYEYDYEKPFTLDQYNTIPNDRTGIPVAIYGNLTGLSNNTYQLVFE